MAHRETTAPFVGHNPADHEGSIKTPIYPTSTFKFTSAEEGAAHMETAYGVAPCSDSQWSPTLFIAA